MAATDTVDSDFFTLGDIIHRDGQAWAVLSSQRACGPGGHTYWLAYLVPPGFTLQDLGRRWQAHEQPVRVIEGQALPPTTSKGVSAWT